MKLIDLFEQHPELTPEQIKWLNDIVKGSWEYKNGVVDVEGSVHFTSSGELNKIPVQFGYVSGHFFAYSINLTSLKGAPREVGGAFYVGSNHLTSLEGAPREVGAEFLAQRNKLTSLKGSPREVGGEFDVSYNKLTSLKGAPREVGGSFYSDNNNFKTEPDHSFIKIGGKFHWRSNVF